MHCVIHLNTLDYLSVKHMRSLYKLFPECPETALYCDVYCYRDMKWFLTTYHTLTQFEESSVTAVGCWRLPMIHWPFLVKQPFPSLCVYAPTLTGMMSRSLPDLHLHHTDPGSVRGYFLVKGRSSFSPLPSASSKRFVDFRDFLYVIAEVPTSQYEAPRGYCCDLELHKSNWSYHSRQSHSDSEHIVSQLWTRLWAPAWATAVFDGTDWN